MLSALVLTSLLLGLGGEALVPSGGAPARMAVDSARVVADLRTLSSPAMAGRETGTAGNEAAREYIHREMIAAGLLPAGGSWFHQFPLSAADTESGKGVNVIGWVPGGERQDRYIVVTAHYDHLGIRNGRVFHGADDNASGTAALLELARYFTVNPPATSIVFAALDAEEMGLRGARAFVADPPVPLGSIVLNVNMDMMSRNEAGEIWAAGTYHYPFLTPRVEAAADLSELIVRLGHDRPGDRRDDWTMLSDHAAFHEVGIPFVYYGVEDHEDYHSPTDTFENIDPAFFVRAVETVRAFLEEADVNMHAIEGRGR